MNDEDNMRVRPWAARMAIRCIVGFYIAVGVGIAVALLLS